MTQTATPVAETARQVPTIEEQFLFDLNGFLILRGAVNRETCADLLAAVRDCEKTEYPDAWWHKIPEKQRSHRTKDVGVAHQVRLNGLPRLDPRFDKFVGHPAVLPYLKAFQGDPQLVNTWSISKDKGTRPGGWHSGYGPEEYTVRNGVIRSPMLNVVLMLTPNTAGDGCLIVQPGSHKRNFTLPWQPYGSMGKEMPGAIEVTGDVGDVVLFSESLYHNGDHKNTTGLRTNLYYNHMAIERSVVMFDRANVHHYWLPPEVRERFTPEQKHLTRWMEWIKFED